MKIGYARVSTDDQVTALQRDALQAAGCEQIYEDRGISGVAKKRPALEEAMQVIGKGDVLIVWRLDRLGRSLSDLLRISEELVGKGAHLHSLQDGIDTTNASGKLVFHIMGSLAEFERSLLTERTRAGLEAARRRGVVVGRRPKVTKAKLDHALRLIESGIGVPEVAKTLGVGRSTLYQALQLHERRKGAA